MAKDRPAGGNDSTQWGGNFGRMRKKKDGCDPWQRAYCLEVRAEHEPESLQTGDPSVLRCPRCGFTVSLEAGA